MNDTPPTSTESEDEPTATDGPNSTRPGVKSFADPESLRDRDDVPFVEETIVHDDADHCSVSIEGRAVVGVTNDDGEVLLAIHEEASVAMLPHSPVESDDDWAAVGRRAVEKQTGVGVDIDGPELVRDVEHYVEDDDELHTATYNVVFRASHVADRSGADDPGVPKNDDWDAEWFDELPENLTDGGPVEKDVRLFLD
jgi:hypothetical protein